MKVLAIPLILVLVGLMTRQAFATTSALGGAKMVTVKCGVSAPLAAEGVKVVSFNGTKCVDINGTLNNCA